MGNEQFYHKNYNYSQFLDRHSEESYKKYSDKIIEVSKEDDAILDVGCGTGTAMLGVTKSNRKITGVDVSTTSVELARKKDLICEVYDGKQLPFKDENFQIVGSFNVLEHTDDPVAFLEEQYRVLKSSGYLIAVCPNFLSITNGYHYHTRGIFQKMKNLTGTFWRLLSQSKAFKKMHTDHHEIFQSDDDACNVTNPVNILNWSKTKNLKLTYWSSQSVYKKGIINFIDRWIFRYFLGSSFVIFQKL